VGVDVDAAEAIGRLARRPPIGARPAAEPAIAPSDRAATSTRDGQLQAFRGDDLRGRMTIEASLEASLREGEFELAQGDVLDPSFHALDEDNQIDARG
jgi:hypothetical protein